MENVVELFVRMHHAVVSVTWVRTTRSASQTLVRYKHGTEESDARRHSQEMKTAAAPENAIKKRSEVLVSSGLNVQSEEMNRQVRLDRVDVK